jgi:hypothetical protein
MPVGSPQYVADVLSGYAAKVEGFSDLVVDFVHHAPPDAPARQAGTLLLRYCLASKAAHLLRLLPPDVTAPLTARVDAAMARGFAMVNQLDPAEVEESRFRIGLPLADGGLGLRPLEWSRHTAHVASWLQCAAGVAKALGDAIPELRDWGGDWLPCQTTVTTAVRHLNDAFGIDALQLAGASWSDFAAASRSSRQRVLTRATIDVRRDRWVATAGPRDRQVLLSSSCRDDRPGAGAWLCAIPQDASLCLSDEAFTFALRLRLG